MSYKEKLFENALKLCEEIYRESQYNKEVDLYRSYDIINATNYDQLASKEWLVEKLSPFLKEKKYLRDGDIRDVLVMGAWYGVTGMILRQHLDYNVKIWNIDSDPMCEQYGKKLQEGVSDYEHNWFHTEDAIEYFFDRTDAFQLVINTSCEHMEKEDVDLIINLKTPNTIVCFQSNNFHSQAEHINTFNSVEEFEKSLDLIDVYWSGTLETSSCERYMVIGI